MVGTGGYVRRYFVKQPNEPFNLLLGGFPYAKLTLSLITLIEIVPRVVELEL